MDDDSNTPLDYETPSDTPRTTTEIDRKIFGVLIPNALLLIGCYASVNCLSGRGETAGFMAVFAFLAIPIVVVLGIAGSSSTISTRTRSRLGALILGSIIPAILLLIFFFIIDGMLPAKNRFFGPWLGLHQS